MGSYVPQRASKRVKHVLCGVVLFALVEITDGEFRESVLFLKVAIECSLAAKMGFSLAELIPGPICDVSNSRIHDERVTLYGYSCQPSRVAGNL